MGISLPLGAQDVAKALSEKGYRLADTLCKSCHLIEDKATMPVPVGVPSFRAIANRKGQTGQRIRDVLMQPHPPMPDIQLSNDEILSIVAYIESLRTDESIPPLLEPKGTKPKYPTPS